MKCKAVEITMLLCCFLEELRSFLEELNNLLEVRMRFSKLPLRIRLRWSSAGRVMASDSRCKYTTSLMFSCDDFQPLYAIIRHYTLF